MVGNTRNDSAPSTHDDADGDRAANAVIPEEPLYHQTIALLREPRTPKRKSWSTLFLLVSAGLFVLALMNQFDPVGILILVGVILLHETGHYVGMRLFNFRDVRMFFIPFFGAAVVGQKQAAPNWQLALVYLLGPLPGIALAGILYISLRPTSDDGIVFVVIVSLLILNFFNLAPLVPLDGGRLLACMLFDRHPFLAGGFQILSAAALGTLGWYADMWIASAILYGLAALTLILAPFEYFRTRQQVEARKMLAHLPKRMDDLDESQWRDLYSRARVGSPDESDPIELVDAMKTLHEGAVRQPTSLSATIALLLLYGAACLAGAILSQQILHDLMKVKVRHITEHVERDGRRMQDC